jgi:acyl carrier protein
MADIISSRTPEGQPNRCPLCGAAVAVEPSQPAGDAPCPHCGTLLWFIQSPEGPRFYDRNRIEQLREHLQRRLAEQLGVEPEKLDLETLSTTDLAADSLDMVELVMELEEEFDLEISNDEQERIQTLRDLLRPLLQRLPPPPKGG